jgi:hypothetical protein
MAAAVSHTANSVQAFFRNSEREATELEPFVVKLGQAGWTIPLEWVPSAYQRFVDNIPVDQFDKAFVAYYSADSEKEAKGLFAHLLAAPGLAGWRTPLRQAIWAFTHRKYHITGTALLPILEGAVARAAKQTSVRTKEHAADAYEKARYTRKLIWASVRAFLDTLYEYHPFSSSSPPDALNRHWVLHGRATRRWTKADCLRLFQAIDTVSPATARRRPRW